MFFTNKGKVYMKKCYQIPEAGRTAKGTAIVNMLNLDPDEKVIVSSYETYGDNDVLILR